MTTQVCLVHKGWPLAITNSHHSKLCIKLTSQVTTLHNKAKMIYLIYVPRSITAIVHVSNSTLSSEIFNS